jgi:ketosteroid isomerase-like protein
MTPGTPQAIVGAIDRRCAAGDVDGAFDPVAADVTRRAAPNGAGRAICGIPDGRDAVRRIHDASEAIAFARLTPDRVIAEGDTVAVRVTTAGAVRATGAAVATSVTPLSCIADGRVVDVGGDFDPTSLGDIVGVAA